MLRYHFSVVDATGPLRSRSRFVETGVTRMVQTVWTSGPDPRYTVLPGTPVTGDTQYFLYRTGFVCVERIRLWNPNPIPPMSSPK